MPIEDIGARRGQKRRKARQTHRKSRRAHRKAARASGAMNGYRLEFLGLGTVMTPTVSGGTAASITIRAQHDNIPVALYLASTVEGADCTISAWQIAGDNVLRNGLDVAVSSFHPKNAQRPGYAWPQWRAGTDMTMSTKNYAAASHVMSGGMLVLRKYEGR